MRNLIGLGLWAVVALVQAQGMTTQGSFSVSETGAATYAIPIQVPPGTSGMEPKLALTYNSQGGNGLLGVGWSLSGLSAITRCPRTMPQDGVRGSVNYDLNDRYCLDGQRLIAISGAYGGNGTEYRTEQESFLKAVSYGSAGNGPASFKVWTRDGLVMEYGATANSAIEAQGKPTIAVWAVNKVSDVKGNYFTVTYTKDSVNGAHYPARIDYTGNSNTGLAPNSSVQFAYENRPDVVSGYRAGSMALVNKRLLSITTYLQSAIAKSYTFNYSQSMHTSRSRLGSLKECNATGSCLPTMTFTSFESGTKAFQSPVLKIAAYGTNAGWSDDDTYPRMLIDVNGDGLPDIVGFASDGVYVSLNTGGSFAAATRWIADYSANSYCNLIAIIVIKPLPMWCGNNTTPRMLADVNGDGLPDIVGFSCEGVYVSLNTGTSFAAAKLWIASYGTRAGGWSDNNNYPRTLADVNGDGLLDIVGFASGGVYVSLNTGTSFAAPVLWIATYGKTNGWSDNNVYPRMLADVNGDGLPDIVGFGDAGAYVSLNTGTSFAPGTLWVASYGKSVGWNDSNIYPRMLADVNGDGLPDIVGFASDGVYVSLNTGTSFAAPVLWIATYGKTNGWSDSNAYPRMLADVNGDGLPDIVGFGDAGVYVSLNTGTSFAAPVLWVANYGKTGWKDNNTYPRMLVDVNGDGLPDVVGFASNGVNVSLASTQPLVDSMAGFNNGIGASVALNYKSLVDSTFYTKGANASFPVQTLQFPMYAISSVSASNGIGGTLTSNYKYGGLKAEVGKGRGLLGFAWQESTQAETGLTTRTEFRQDFPYTGMPSRVTVSKQGAGNGGLLKETVSTFACLDTATGGACAVAAGKRYFTYASQSVEKGWDLNGAALPVLTTTQQFDAWGNATMVKVSTSDGHEKITTSTYSNDATKWHLGRLLRSKVQSTAPDSTPPPPTPTPQPQYAVTYNYAENGGTSTTVTSVLVNSGAVVDLTPTAKRLNPNDWIAWEFVGWNTNKDATTALTSYTMPASDVMLYAIYKLTQTVTLKDVSGTTPTTRTVAVTIYNKTTSGNINIPAANTYTGWTTRGWGGGSSPVLPDRQPFIVSGIHPLSSSYTEATYYGLYQRNATASYNANGGTPTPPSQTGIRYVNSQNIASVKNPSVTLPGAITRAGYTFDGWVSSADGTKFNAGATVQLSGDTTFTAAWK